MTPLRLLLLLPVALLLTGSVIAADVTGLLKDGSWHGKLRKDHPRLFLNAADLPALRQRAATTDKAAFDALVQTVEKLPADAPFLPDEKKFTRDAAGVIKPLRAGYQGCLIVKYDGGTQAAQAALVHAVKGDPASLEKAKNYLRLHAKVLDWTAKGQIWMDLLGQTRINALFAYDLIYNKLTPAERRELLLPILDYITKTQPNGEYKFRRTIGGPTDGNYGERALEYFAGIVAAGDGIDDARADAMLRRGAALFVEMMDHREKISAGSGLLSAVTVGYTFGAYPYSTFHFLRSWRAAFGEDLTDRWTQMCDYPNWFDWSAIKITPNGKFLYYGIGDLEHRDNMLWLGDMYTHLAQAIHFYGAKHPDKASQAYVLLGRLPEQSRVLRALYPFVPFLVPNFDPNRIATADPAKIPPRRYFFAPSFGLLFMRSGTGPQDTFASFRGGSPNGNHQHYDELSFIIYKHDFLALDSGSRTETDHHHNYVSQSVAHNTILIHEPKEEMPPFWKAWSYKPDGKTYYNHGGQHFNTRAKTLALQSTPDFIYAAADATASYREAKCREAVRQFVYLKPDLFVVYDRVTSVKPEQRKEFLLHTQNRPEKLAADLYRADHHQGRLYIRTLLPESADIRLEGGPGREFFASGRNWELPGGKDWDKIQKLTGKWRMEIAAPQSSEAVRFLHVLEAADIQTGAMSEAARFTDGDFDGVRITDRKGTRWELRFRRSGPVGLTLKQTDAAGRVVFDQALPNAVESLQ